MSDLNIRHHQDFDKVWKKATADGVIDKQEVAELKEAAAKTQDGKSVAREQTDDYLVEQLEKGYGHSKVTFTHTGGKNITAELGFLDGEAHVSINPKQVTDKNVDEFLKQRSHDGYVSSDDRQAVETALKNTPKGSEAHKKLTAWLDKLYPGATEGSRQALAKTVMDPKASPKDREQALLNLCLNADKDPKLVRSLLFKVVAGEGQATREMRSLAAVTMGERKWGDEATFEKMLQDDNPDVRRGGIKGLGNLGTDKAVGILDKHHQKTASTDDQREVIGALWRIEEKGPAKAAAAEAARRLGKKADEEFVADYKQEESAKASRKSIAEKVKGFDAKDAKDVKAYLTKHGDEVLEFGAAADKGKMVGILMKDSSPEAKAWVFKLLMSAYNEQDLNAMTGAMLAVTKTPPNMEGYLGKARYDQFNTHRWKMSAAEDNIAVNSSKIAQGNDFGKKVQAVGEHINLARLGGEDKGVAAARVKELLVSLGSREAYERAVKELGKLGYSEKDITWLLGEGGRKEVFKAYDAPKAAPIGKDQAPKWTGGKIFDFAAKGSHAPDHHDKQALSRFMGQVEHFGLEHGALHVAEHALAHWGYHAAGVAVSGLGAGLAAASWMKMVFEELGDANGPGQWRTSLHYGYMDGYADGIQAMAQLWQDSQNMDDFMSKLSTIMPDEGQIDMSDDKNANFRSLGNFQGQREAIVYMLTLLDPEKGGSPEKFASAMDELARVKGGDNAGFADKMDAAVHRKFDADH